MKKRSLTIVLLTFVLALALVFAVACDKGGNSNNGEGDAHVCGHVCPTCQKCTDASCTDPACAEKCAGHGGSSGGGDTHACAHVCPTCQKCTDASCANAACAQKCPGHTSPDPHVCQHVCPICQKCTDASCGDSACAQKCEGHGGISHDHSYGDWSIIVGYEPTIDHGGKAKRVCSDTACGGIEIVDIPALSVSATWSKSHTDADYKHAGADVYTSIYGEVTIVIPKLVAPYDGKVYHSIAFESGEEKIRKDDDGYRHITVESAWVSAALTVNENGVGIGSAYPFQGKIVFTMVDAEQGLITIDYYGDGSEVEKSVDAYIDMETGIIVMPDAFNADRMHFCVPTDSQLSSASFETSYIETAYFVEYSENGEPVMTICVDVEGEVYMNVYAMRYDHYSESYEMIFATCDISKIEDASIIIVNNDEDECIAIYTYVQYVGFVVAGDEIGIYKAYKDDKLDIVVLFDGAGMANILDVGADAKYLGLYEVGQDGTIYMKVYDSDYIAYMEITLSGDGLGSDGTLVYEQIRYTLTMNLNGKVLSDKDMKDWEVEDGQIIFERPKYSAYYMMMLAGMLISNDEQYVVIGWYEDEECTIEVQLDSEGSLEITEDITVYAKWGKIVSVTISGARPEDNDTIKVGAGSIWADVLPAYVIGETTDDDDKNYFTGWTVDSTPLDVEGIIVEGDSGKNVVATWAPIPVYAGAYNGTLYRDSAFNSGLSVTLIIDNFGNIKCYTSVNGSTNPGTVISAIDGAKVVSYDAATQKVFYKLSDSDSVTRCFYLADDGSFIVGLAEDDYTIGNEYYILLKGFYPEVSEDRYNIATSANSDNCPHLFVINGKNVMFYENHIYQNIVLKNAAGDILSIGVVLDAETGEPTDAPRLCDSKTVVIYDDEGEIILAVGATGSSLASAGVVALDDIYGSYVVEASEVVDLFAVGSTMVLDGMGNVSATARYEKVTGESYIAIYIYSIVDEQPVDTMYLRATIDDGKISITKPMATLTISVVGVSETISGGSINVNIPYALPQAPTVQDYLFIGYFTDSTGTNAIEGGTITLTEDTEIYAIYSYSVVLTVVYNNGTAQEEIIAERDAAYTITVPTYARHAFAGWYTTSTFDEGSEWTSGTTVLTANTTIYAKWVDAPAYNNDYYYVRMDSVSASNGVGAVSASWNYNLVAVDTVGHATVSGMPWGSAGGAITIAYADQATGKISVTTANSKVYYGYVDKDSGIMVINDAENNQQIAGAVWIYSPYETKVSTYTGSFSSSKISNSYWADGSCRAISYTYTDAEEQSHTICMLIAGGRVYFGDAFVDGNDDAVAANACHEQDAIVLKNGAATVTSLTLKVTITLVYGNGLQNASAEVYAGGALNLSAYNPAYTNGQLLDYWCTDSDLENQFTAASVTEDTTLYCKWKDSAPYEFVTVGEHAWTYSDGKWTSGNYNVASSTSELLINIYADSYVAFDYAGSGEGGNYDNLFIYVNGSQVDKVGEKKNLSDITYKHFVLDAKAGDFIKLLYTKDNGGNHNDDCGQIKNVSIIVYAPVTLTYNYNGQGTTANVVNMTAADVVETLVAVDFKYGNKVFAGWYTKDGTGGDWGEEFLAGTRMTESITVYAKWLDEVVLTVIYANAPADKVAINAMQDVTISYPAGATIAPTVPEYTEGMAFSHWSLTATGAAIDFTTISEDTTIYAVWMEAYSMMGSYKGFNLYYSSEGSKSETKTETSQLTAASAEITAAGLFQGSQISSSAQVQIDSSYKNVTNGAIQIKGSYAYVNVEYGILWYTWSSSGNATSCGTDTCFLMKGDVKSVDYSIVCNKNGSTIVAWAAWLTIKYDDDRTRDLFLLNDVIYAGATWSSAADGSAVTAKNAATTDVIIYVNGSDIAANINKKIVTRDAVAGTYHTSGSDDEMVLNGYGALTVSNAALSLENATGTYVAAASGATYGYDVVIGGENYELTLGAGNTYTLVKPMVTVSFDMGGHGDAEPSQSVNKGQNFTMPGNPEAAGYIFQGWFAASDFSGGRKWSAYKVSEDTTLYAKWAEEVTLTIHWNDTDTTVKKYSAGASVQANDIKPSNMFADGAIFVGIYTDNTYATAYVPGVINSSTDVYARYYSKEGVQFSNGGASYTFVATPDGDAMTFVSNNASKSNSTAKLIITATADCTVAFSYAGGSESGYDKLNITTTGTGDGVKDVSGTDKSGNVSIQLEAGQTITIAYTKDSGTDGGIDKYIISNLVVTLDAGE